MLMDSHEEIMLPKAVPVMMRKRCSPRRRDREITFDAAALIQALSIDHRPTG